MPYEQGCAFDLGSHLRVDRDSDSDIDSRLRIVTGSGRLRKGDAGGCIAAALDGGGRPFGQGLGRHDQLGG